MFHIYRVHCFHKCFSTFCAHEWLFYQFHLMQTFFSFRFDLSYILQGQTSNEHRLQFTNTSLFLKAMILSSTGAPDSKTFRYLGRISTSPSNCTTKILVIVFYSKLSFCTISVFRGNEQYTFIFSVV